MAITAQGRNEGLDMLRGICAVAIAVYHYLAWDLDTVIQSMGSFSVYAFFILSAVTMMIAYAERFGSAITVVEIQKFYVARCARILPLLIVVSAASAALAIYDGSAIGLSISKFYMTATTLFALQQPGFVSNSAGAWSLGIESGFYVVFPILAIVAVQARLRSMAWFLLFIVSGQIALLFIVADKADPEHWDYYVSPLTFAPYFLIGLFIYRLAPRRTAANTVFALLGLLVLFTFSMVFPVDLFRVIPAHLFLMAVTSVAVYFAFASRLPLWAVPIAVFLGEISYALYLTHPFSSRLARWLVTQGLPVVLQPLTYGMIALLVAYATYRFFEHPMRQWIRQKAPVARPIAIKQRVSTA